MPFDPNKPYQKIVSTGSGESPPDKADDGGPLDVPPWVRSNKGNYDRNKAWAKPPGEDGYQTKLSPDQEKEFQKWAADNHIKVFAPDDPAPGYDHRGFWLGMKEGDEKAISAVNPNDHTLHLNDKWKTPYFESFSDESKWATKDAPKWNEKDQLIDKSGNVIYDERGVDDRRKKRQRSGQGWGTPESPETDLTEGPADKKVGFDPSKPYQPHPVPSSGETD